MKTIAIYHQTKAIAVLLAIIFNYSCSQKQDITGQWNGVLMNMRLVFHINKTGDGYTSTMDSPDQGASGLAVATTKFDGSKLSITMPNIGLTYEGEFKTDSVVGIFKQGALSLPMTLKRTVEKPKPLVRPQEPKPPYPYISEDITFENKSERITLAGTLTMPATGSNFTAVILISGSGQQDRNEEMLGHKPFLVIADYLTRNGIAVLRYDDRGTAQSTGNFHTANLLDFAVDAESAIAYLKTRKEINPLKIGLMGHSEGGEVAPMVTVLTNDVDFIVILAGSGIRGYSLALLQQELLLRTSGASEDEIAKALKISSEVINMIAKAMKPLSQKKITDFIKTNLKDEIAGIIPEGMTEDDFIKMVAKRYSSPYMQYLLNYDPAPVLERVKCPVLAVTGSMDLQVPPKENLTAISAALKKGGNHNVTVKEYPGLNHLFQKCTTGSMDEYAIIEETFSPEVLNDITEWIINNK